MGSLAIIPARGGSKRIQRKNIKLFFEKPIITYAIDVALRSNLFEEIIVSTDDFEIASIAIKAGANVPFMRSLENSGDISGTEEVILEVLKNYEEKGKTFESVCCIYPTTPLLTPERLKESRDILIDGSFDTVFPVLRFGYPVQRALKYNNNKIQMVWPEYEDFRSQDLEPYFHDAGQFYWVDVEIFKHTKKLFSQNSGFIELSEMEAQDIDNYADWQLAELKFNRARKNE